MSSNHTRPAPRIMLTMPVLFLVLAATALPIEFRPLSEAQMGFEVDDVLDIVANIIGYLPVGLVLGAWGWLRAVIIAGVLSTVAETGQLVMMHRDPSWTDIMANLAGAALGALACTRWRLRAPALQLHRGIAILAALLACALVLYAWSMAGVPVNTRGATSSGTLEASWQLDAKSGRVVLDTSGHGLVGTFRAAPQQEAGVRGPAAVFDGANYVDFGRSTALRLAGSMTITAWISSSAYPGDDAVIVSQLGTQRGYQLDTTIDQGPRTIGFKLSDACGHLMARYGATPLALHTWYHVAGVYDAAAQTLDVYLNGALDDGVLRGSVSPAQRSARGAVYVGRRGNFTRYNFSGLMERVRIYSFALTPAQIVAEMRGDAMQAPATSGAVSGPPCPPLSDRNDQDLPFAAAVLGTLVAVAGLGAWPSAARLLVLSSSGAAGALLVATAADLPAFAAWMLPLVALAGGASIVVSVRHQV